MGKKKAAESHASYKACIAERAQICQQFKKKHERHGRFKKSEKVKRNKAKARRERINAKRAANGRTDFIKRSYNRKKFHPDLQAVMDANP